MVIEQHQVALLCHQSEIALVWFALARAFLLQMHPDIENAATDSDALRSLGFDDTSEPNDSGLF